MKIMKKLSAFMLSLIMIVGMVPVMAVKADSSSTAAAITLGDKRWVDSTTKTEYTFPNAKANFNNGGQKIFCLSVSDEGYFVPQTDIKLGENSSTVDISGVELGSGYTATVEKGKKYTSITVIDSAAVGSLTNEKITYFLKNLVFSRNGVDVDKEQRVTVVANQVALGDNMTAVAIDGKLHYYKYVSWGSRDADPDSTWYKAYKEAKESTFDGMQGYLATITSELEQQYVFKKIMNGTDGWIGGARTLDVDVDGNTIVYDADKIDKLNPGSRATGAPQGKEWKWVSGPEAGDVFYVINTLGEWQNSGTAKGYTAWDSNEPNNKQDNVGEMIRDEFDQEYCLQYGYGTEGKWNDWYPACNESSTVGMLGYGVEGYLIEYSPYQQSTAAGGKNITPSSETKSDTKIVTGLDDETSFIVNVTDPSTGVTGPTKNPSSAEKKEIYNITLPSDEDSITLTPTKAGMTVDTIEITQDGTTKTVTPGTDASKETVKIDNIKMGDNTAQVIYKVKDTSAGDTYTYTYNISRNPGAEAGTEVKDPDPSTPDIPKIEPGDRETSGTEVIQKITITVPADQSELTVYPKPLDGAKLDTTYGVKKTSTAGNVKENKLAESKPEFTIDGLVSTEDAVVCVKVVSEDGKSSTIYEYTIKREKETRITPVDPKGTDTGKIKEEDDPSQSSTTTDIYKVITIPSTMDDLKLIPNLPERATVSVKEGGTDKTEALNTDNSYVVKDIVSGQDRDVVYTVETPTGTINYHYTIKKDAAPKKTSTDATVDTADKTPSGKEDKAKVSDPDTSVTNEKKYTIMVPYDQTDVTITTIPKDGATVDSTIKKNLTGTAKVVEDVSVADSIKVKDLEVGSNGTVSVDVIAEDGSTKTTYVYEIVREAGKTNTITPSLPSDSTGTITGPTEDTTKTTDDDKYYTIVLPNGTDKVTMTPKINDGDKVTSITVDGSKVDTIPADGVYTVTEVTTDKAKDLVYEITDPDGNVKRYHYTISQEKKPEEPKKNDPTDRKDPTITDITVKTDDNITTPADVKIDNNNTNKTIDVTVPSNQTDYTFTPATKDPSSKITEVAKVSGPAEVSTSSDGKSFTAKGLDPKTPTIVKVTVTSSTGDTATYTVTIHRAEEGVTPDISVEMDGGSMDLNSLIPEDVRKNAKEILYHCCAHTVLAIDKDGTVRSIGRSNKYKSSLVHVIVKSQDNKWTDYTIYVKVNGATKKEEYGTLVDYKGLNYEITGEDTCRVSSWKTNYNTKKKNIVIPDTIKANGKTYKVTAIAPGAFMRNSKIVTIKIGKNVQEIGNTSFVGLRKIKKFTISKKNKYLKVAGKSGNKAKMILSKNGKVLYSMTNMQGSATIPKSVKQITEYAGAGNVKMTKLVIPASVKRIDPCAFAHAKKMTYVQFKGKVPEMANNCVVDQMNYKKGKVYVPKKYYKQYKSAFQTASKKRYGIKQFPAMSHLKKK